MDSLVSYKTGLVARLKRRLSPFDLAQIEAIAVAEGVSGEDILSCFAAMIGRAGQLRQAKNRARLIRNATGGTRATGLALVTFSQTIVEGFALAPGQILFQTPWGVRFRITEAIAEPDGGLPETLPIAVEAERVGFDGNVEGFEITEWAIPDTNNRNSLSWTSGTDSAKDAFLAGVRDGSIYFEMAEATTGGSPATLDLRARGLGQARADGEPDAPLRVRLQIDPDAVTPNGIVRAVNSYLGRDPAIGSGEAHAVEGWEFGFAWGLHGWGLHGWGGPNFAIVYVPEGADTAAIQLLVDRLAAFGYTILVLTEA